MTTPCVKDKMPGLNITLPGILCKVTGPQYPHLGCHWLLVLLNFQLFLPSPSQVYVLKRPHVDEFLRRMGEMFECVLFTASLAKVSLKGEFHPRKICKKIQLVGSMRSDPQYWAPKSHRPCLPHHFVGQINGVPLKTFGLIYQKCLVVKKQALLPIATNKLIGYYGQQGKFFWQMRSNIFQIPNCPTPHPSWSSIAPMSGYWWAERVDSTIDTPSPAHSHSIFSCLQYADPVADLLDKWGAFRARLFRESCAFHRGNYVKDLSRLGRDLNKLVIIDNSPASYIFHPDNAVWHLFLWFIVCSRLGDNNVESL